MLEMIDGAVDRFMAGLQENCFYGIVELHFQAGQVVRVKKQEVFLPKDLK